LIGAADAAATKKVTKICQKGNQCDQFEMK
jgi:hypothetical protein